MSKKVIAIDQGTTSSRAVLFDSANNLLDFEQMEIEQHFPHDGWVTANDKYRFLLDKPQSNFQGSVIQIYEFLLQELPDH